VAPSPRRRPPQHRPQWRLMRALGKALDRDSRYRNAEMYPYMPTGG
jgi:hypothetical protein